MNKFHKIENSLKIFVEEFQNRAGEQCSLKCSSKYDYPMMI